MEFNFAKVTNSRLMGSMGLIISWLNKEESYYQYFLLDAEGLGIADYVSLKNPTHKQAYMEEERLMGGLGSEKIRLTKKEALFLVKHFGNKNFYYEKELPGCVEEYIDIIKKYETDLNIYDLYPKICKKINEEVEFINYMTMRFIAWDREGLGYFAENKEIASMHITNINGTLLKNKVNSRDKGRFISEAIYEDDDGYYTCKIAFTIEKHEDRFKIKSMLATGREYMYDYEVFDEISKHEFISIYSILDKSKISNFVTKFYEDNPFMLKSEMNKGMFFTRFNFNNDHVKENVYVINNDIKAIYYQMGRNFFVGTYNERDKNYVNKLLQSNYSEYIKMEDELYFEENALYDFVESESDDFDDFLD